MKTRTVSLPGCEVEVFDSAPGSSQQAVVFVHGNPGPMDDFEALIPALASFSRVIAFDMSGFGRAARTRLRDVRVATYGEHLGAVLGAVNVDRAHLVLHDFGGFWGLHWAAHHPASTASITLINTGHPRGYRWHAFARIWQTPLVGPLFQILTTAPAIRYVMNRDNPSPLPRAFLDRVTAHATLQQKLHVANMYRAATDVEALANRLEPGLRRLECPVCVVFGAEDRYFPAHMAERQRDVFPEASVHLLPGLGHWPFIDDAAAVERILVSFLKPLCTLAAASA